LGSVPQCRSRRNEECDREWVRFDSAEGGGPPLPCGERGGVRGVEPLERNAYGLNTTRRASLAKASNRCQACSVVSIAQPTAWRFEVSAPDVAKRICRRFLLPRCEAHHRTRWRPNTTSNDRKMRTEPRTWKRAATSSFDSGTMQSCRIS